MFAGVILWYNNFIYPWGGGHIRVLLVSDGPMLTGKQKRYLRSIGIALNPIVQIGKSGVSESVVNSLDEALAARELVKTRVLKNCLEDPKAIAFELASLTNSHLVQIVGRNILFYRRSEDKPSIELPK